MVSAPRVFRCSGCDRVVDDNAAVCPGCQRELAFCSSCRDVTTLEAEPTEAPASRVGRAVEKVQRARYRCDRCKRLGVRCRTAQVGGACNGLARAEGRLPDQLCARCSQRVWDVSKQVATWTLLGLVGSRIRR